MSMTDIEITKREIIICIGITALLITIGFFVSDRILESATDKEKIYKTAIEVKTKEDFDYILRTEQGAFITESEVKAVKPVSFPNFKGEYTFIEKVKEVYTMHTRQVPIYDSKGKITGYRTEIYWTWDYAGSEKKTSDKLRIHGKCCDVKAFNLIRSVRKGGYQYESSDTRYYYRVIPKKFIASFIASATDKGIQPLFGKHVSLHEKNMDELMEYGKSSAKRAEILFWLIWSILILASNIGFVMLDNEYLN